MAAGSAAAHEGLQARHHKVEERPDTLGHMLTALIQRVDFLAVVTGLCEHLDQPAGGEVLVNVKVGQSGNPHPGNSHTPNGFAVIGLQISLDDAINNAPTLMHGPDRTRTSEIEA